MRQLSLALVLLGMLLPRPLAARPASAWPWLRERLSAALRPSAWLSRWSRGRAEAKAERFMERVARREAGFHQPGVAFDRQTGLTFDGHGIDPRTGALRGGPRNWSAASKESVHISLLVKALQGDRLAQLVISPDQRDPSQAKGVALDLLARKIASYRAFNREHPGFGGFLPWFKVEGGRMLPTDDWTDRVPALDNGQLAWSVYHAAHALQALGYTKLARQYESQLRLMERNVVPIFYDAETHKLRAESKLSASSSLPVSQQRYGMSQNPYYLDDPYEGQLMIHFADLLGKWQAHPEGQAALWSKPHREPGTYCTKAGQKISVAKGWWFSSHEDWGFLVLPYRDDPLAGQLFANAQKVRTIAAVERHQPGLKASTHRPIRHGGPLSYVSDLGISEVANGKVSSEPIYAPYAAFPLALVDKPVAASWLKRMLAAPRMWGPRGMGESFNSQNKAIAPVLTWDGKMLPILSWSGGIADDLRGYLQQDGLYTRFRTNVASDYRAFAGRPLEGCDLQLAPAPPTRLGSRRWFAKMRALLH